MNDRLLSNVVKVNYSTWSAVTPSCAMWKAGCNPMLLIGHGPVIVKEHLYLALVWVWGPQLPKPLEWVALVVSTFCYPPKIHADDATPAGGWSQRFLP